MTGGTLPLLASVTVTYHPDLGMLERQLRGLPEDSLKFVVDNASPPDLQAALAQVLGKFRNTTLKLNGRNLGLAAALNQGGQLALAASPRPDMLLLLDQDSEPVAGSVETLRESFEQLVRAGVPVGCVGPALFDPQTNMHHGFHLAEGLFWKRIQPAAGRQDPVRCTNLNGSGTLMPLPLFQALGGLDEDLFIDHVDTEWSFRVLQHGALLFGIPDACFIHHIGVGTRRIWLFGWRVWPDRAPHRHRILFRNTLTLMRRSYVPAVWKFWAGIKIVLTVVLVTLYGPQRRAQWGAMTRGLLEGLQAGGRRGPAD